MYERARPYDEPGVVQILIQSSFFCTLNLVNHVLDRWIYCGLLGQLFIGVAWGAPGAQWLSQAMQQVFTQLGYLGLILLVYEGGLATSVSALKANLFLSTAIALTGICLPIALSFSLLRLTNATPLQSFAAGAALCSTSLGTTFTVLKTSRLTKSRLGIVLTSAAMMDDVVGLVMVQVIANLSRTGPSVGVTTIIRPILVSLAFAILLPLCCRFIFLPGRSWLESHPSSHITRLVYQALKHREVPHLIHSTLLFALVVGASYAGTSKLFAAYLAGALISWLDTIWFPALPRAHSVPEGTLSCHSPQNLDKPLLDVEDVNGEQSDAEKIVLAEQDPISAVPPPDWVHVNSAHVQSKSTQTMSIAIKASPLESDSFAPTSRLSARTGIKVYEAYYAVPVDRILKPLFFASIGFSIPISQMFTGPTIWRGFVYACLMTTGKLICGLWLVRFNTRNSSSRHERNPEPPRHQAEVKDNPNDNNDNPSNQITTNKPPPSSNSNKSSMAAPPSSSPIAAPSAPKKSTISPMSSIHFHLLPKPKSLYPASILGSAMVARGEIGFLVSAIAQSKGIFSTTTITTSSSPEPDLFLIVTWAIMLCTIIGPVALGLIVKRVRRLQLRREGRKGEGEGAAEGQGQEEDPLGIWGVDVT